MPRTRKNKRKVLRDRYRYVLLTLYDEKLDPDKITQALKKHPTWSNKAGQYRGKSGKIYKKRYGRWSLTSRRHRNASLVNHISDVLEQIQPKRKVLAGLLKKYRASLIISVQPPKESVNSNYVFPAKLINSFTQMGVDIIFSFYDPHTWEEFCEGR